MIIYIDLDDTLNYYTEAILAEAHAYCAGNKDKIKTYRYNNKDRIKEKTKIYADNNLIKINGIRHNLNNTEIPEIISLMIDIRNANNKTITLLQEKV